MENEKVICARCEKSVAKSYVLESNGFCYSCLGEIAASQIEKEMAEFGITNSFWASSIGGIFRDDMGTLLTTKEEYSDSVSMKAFKDLEVAVAAMPIGSKVFAYSFLSGNSGETIVANYSDFDKLLEWFFARSPNGSTSLSWDDDNDLSPATIVPTGYDGERPPATKEAHEARIKSDLLGNRYTQQIAWGEWHVSLTTREELLEVLTTPTPPEKLLEMEMANENFLRSQGAILRNAIDASKKVNPKAEDATGLVN